MISVRLSNEEFRLLQGACIKAGAKSISELARTAMQRIILEQETSPTASTEDQLRDFKLKFQMLAAEMERISRLVRQTSETESPPAVY